MRKTKAFTLIELLVVVSIIALLVSILLPSLGKARDRARDVVCLLNLRNMNSVLFLYANDNSRHFVPHWFALNPDTGNFYINDFESRRKVIWMFAAEKYYSNPDILLCPKSEKTNRSSPTGSPEFGGVFNDAWYLPWAPKLKFANEELIASYAFNDYCGSNPGSFPNNQAWANAERTNWKVVDQKNASDIPVLLDGAWYHVNPIDHNVPPPGDPRIDPGWCSVYLRGSAVGGWGYVYLPRHNGGTNIITLDLSAKRIGLKKLHQLKWHKLFNNTPYASTDANGAFVSANYFADPDYSGWTEPDYIWIDKLPK